MTKTQSLFSIGFIFWLIGVAVAEVAWARPDPAYVDAKIKQAAEEKGVDPELLRAICMSESSRRLDPEAFNYSDGSRRNHAFGICQVLYSTAKGMGLRDEGCKRNFDQEKEVTLDRQNGFREALIARTWKNCKLFGPLTNARYAAKLLAFNLERYKGDVRKAIASYNTGTVLICQTGWLSISITNSRTGKVTGIKKKCKIGELANEYYVLRVEKNIVLNAKE